MYLWLPRIMYLWLPLPQHTTDPIVNIAVCITLIVEFLLLPDVNCSVVLNSGLGLCQPDYCRLLCRVPRLTALWVL